MIIRFSWLMDIVWIYSVKASVLCANGHKQDPIHSKSSMLINILHGYGSFYILGLLTDVEGVTEGWRSLIFTSVVSSFSAGP